MSSPADRLRTPRVRLGRVGFVLSLLAAAVQPARATIVPSSDAKELAQAIAQDPSVVTGAEFVALPLFGTPHGIADASIVGFPVDGDTFGILTTGDVGFVLEPNDAPDSGVGLLGGNIRGDTDYDVTVLRIDLDVPAGRNCLSIDFRFLSEEFPEFIDTEYNDAFIAELDTSSWTTTASDILAPANFAFDPAHSEISINASGVTSMSAAEAIGTTYDGATPSLTASTPITPGAHALYLSIFDQGDQEFDSAVFLDRLVVGTTVPGACQPGATVLTVTKTTGTPAVPEGGEVEYTIVVSNPGDEPVTLDTITDTLPAGFAYVAGSSSGVTTADPTEIAEDLTWNGPFELGATDEVSLSFHAKASTVPGEYLNEAGASSPDAAVTPTGPTAPVNVLPVTTTTTSTLDTTTSTIETTTTTTTSTTTVTPPSTLGATTTTTTTTTTSSSTTTITANRAPDCTQAVATPAVLAPPDQTLHAIDVGGIGDADGDPVGVTITAIAQDEPVDGTADGRTCPDADGIGDATARVRAERGDSGDGRVYHVAFRADDGRGGSCTGSVVVCVPHDGAAATCADQGPSVDSTGPASCPSVDPSDVEPIGEDAIVEIRVRVPGDASGKGKVKVKAIGFQASAAPPLETVAAARRLKPVTKPAKASIAPGASQTLVMRLNRRGRALLLRNGVLDTIVIVQLRQRGVEETNFRIARSWRRR